jgi:hypothetical protein
MTTVGSLMVMVCSLPVVHTGNRTVLLSVPVANVGCLLSALNEKLSVADQLSSKIINLRSEITNRPPGLTLLLFY